MVLEVLANSEPVVQRMRVLGTRIDVLTMQTLVGIVRSWAEGSGPSRWIACTNSHGIMEARQNPEFRAVLESADLSVPDGYRLVKIARNAGCVVAEHLTGRAIMQEVCRVANEERYRMFFYGDTEEVLALMLRQLKRSYPRIEFVGAISPPFQRLSTEEEQAFIDEINKAKPHILWVGLGLPKQERWIARNIGRLRVPVSLAVGAAFKFHSGVVPPAPKWMVDRGLEWAWRFAHEPRRLFKRVVVHGPMFLAMVRLQRARLLIAQT